MKWVLLMSLLQPDATASLMCQYAPGRRSVVKALWDFKLCDCQDWADAHLLGRVESLKDSD